jgi:hypothetical protein
LLCSTRVSTFADRAKWAVANTMSSPSAAFSVTVSPVSSTK